MAWTYEIVSGKLYRDNGESAGSGYSGADPYKNDENAQSIQDEGPIPAGIYRIGAPQNTVTHGPFVLPLTPDPKNLMWGRSGFLIHGDSKVAPGTASKGCIIMPRDVRQQVWDSGDRTLDVIARLEGE